MKKITDLFVIASTSSDNRGLFFSFIGSGYFLEHSD